MFPRKTTEHFDLTYFWTKKDGVYYYALHNKKRQPVKVGVFDKKTFQLIDGIHYLYDQNDSLTQIEFIDNGIVEKDSTIKR